MHKWNKLRNYSSGAQQRRVQEQLIISSILALTFN